MTTKAANACCAPYGQTNHIIEADCVYENGCFVFSGLPVELPSRFNLRFTAPADYRLNDKLSVWNSEIALKTLQMTDAPELAFAERAIVCCAIDLKRKQAFISSGGGDTGGFKAPDISYEEQFAGFHDLDGRKVYVKTIELGNLPGKSDLSRIETLIPLSIPGFLNAVDMRLRWVYPPIKTTLFENANSLTHLMNFSISEGNIRIIVDGMDYRAASGRATVYYTCTDR